MQRSNPHALSSVFTYEHVSPRYYSFLANISKVVGLTLLLKMSKIHFGVKRMELEIQALENNKTWTLQTLPPTKKTVGV